MSVKRFILIALIGLGLNAFVTKTYAQFIIKVNTTVGTGTGTLGDASSLATPSGEFFLRSGFPTTGVNITVKDITGTTVLHTYTGVSGGQLIKNSDWSGTQTSYQIEYTGLTSFDFYSAGDVLKLTEVAQWGTSSWSRMRFWGAANMDVTATDLPSFVVGADLSYLFAECKSLVGNSTFNSWNTTNVTNMAAMFQNCSLFNQPIGLWDTSNVTNMTDMFRNAIAFNQPIGSWTTNNVTGMGGMFFGAAAFNQPLNSWNTGNVISMQYMFAFAPSFNQNLNSWSTGKVTSMAYMFTGAKAFNGAIGNWTTSSVTDMTAMFQGAEVFNQSIGLWDTQNVIGMNSMFYNDYAFNQPIDTWNTGKVIDMAYMFANAISFNQNLNGWNTSSVTNMRSMFHGAIVFNGDISSWTTSSVTDMSSMFNQAYVFNQNIGGWDTGNVTNMYSMFGNAKAFNQDLSGWNTGNVIYMSWMFYNAITYNQPMALWDTKNVIDMSYMFAGAGLFNYPIDNWVTSNVTDMQHMFLWAIAFNQDISRWQTGKVTNMQGMLSYAKVFNQNLNSWDVSNVTNMYGVFQGASAFNSPLSNWKTGKVTNMGNMFWQAYAFDQSLATFDISSVTSMDQMLSYSGMSQNNYDATLIAWEAATKQNNVALGAINLSFCAATNERFNLITVNGWTITGDGLGCTPGGVNNRLTWWLDAAKGPRNAGSIIAAGPIDKWRGRNVIANTPPTVDQATLTAQPTLIANNLNFNPVVRFDGVNDQMSAGPMLSGYRFDNTNGLGSYTVYMVGRFDGAATPILSHEDTTTPIRSTVSSAGISSVNGASTETLNASSAASGLQLRTYSYIPQVIIPPVAPSTTPTVYNGYFNTFVNGVLDAFTGTSLQTLPNATGTFNVGGNAAGSQFFQGDLAEAVFYSYGIGSAPNTNRTRVESYLAIKYGLTLAEGTAYNYESTAGDVIWTGNSTYQYHIAGIGRDDLTSQNQKQSQSSNTGSQLVLALDAFEATGNLAHTGTIAADKQFLVWGDDNGSLTGLAAIAKPFTNGKRMARLWRVQNTNTFNQQVTVYYPTNVLSTLFGSLPFSLVYSDVNNFSSTNTMAVAPTGTQTINGVAYTAFQLTFPTTGTLYMSFGADFPLPKQVMVNPAGISTNIQNGRMKY